MIKFIKEQRMNIVLIAIAILLIVKCIQWHLKRYKFIKCLQKYPGPPPLPIFGNTWELRTPKAVLDKFMEYQREYGRIVKVYSGQIPNILLITDYELTKFILSSTTILGKAPKYKYLEKWLGTGLLLSEGDKWRNRRKIITPTFHFEILEQFLGIFGKNNKILIEKLKKEVDKPSIDIYLYLKLYGLDVICETAMGTYVGAQKNADLNYVHSVNSLCRIFVERSFNLFLQYPFTYILSKQHKIEQECIKVTRDYTNSVINKRKAEFNIRDNIDHQHSKSSKKKMVFLDLLLQERQKGCLMTDEDIREEVDVFMFEGHDTLTSAVGFALHCLVENPEVQSTVVKELRNIFKDDEFRNPTLKDLQAMKYLNAVIQETLRLYPTAPMFGRLLPNDIIYDGTELPKGLTFLIFSYGIHRNPEVFPDPEKFIPERFFYENRTERPPYSYIPFSAGPRNCIGQKYAMLQIKSVLAAILWHYEILPAIPRHNLDLVVETVLKSSNGVRVRLANRQF